MTTRDSAEKVANLVRDAGGRIVGRTRLQKTAYLLWAAGLEDSFAFEYEHYGPFSKALANAARKADLLGLLTDAEQPAQWGGSYSTYMAEPVAGRHVDEARQRLAAAAAAADAIQLELAATAVFLAKENYPDPWGETARRKPDKADGGRLEQARALYRRLQAVETPVRLPEIA